MAKKAAPPASPPASRSRASDVTEADLAVPEPAIEPGDSGGVTFTAPPDPETGTQPAAKVQVVESHLALVRRARKISRELAITHPDAHIELDFRNPLELLVATILSAQCTDKKVNETTPKLFARYPTAADYASADRAELEEMIKPTGFYRNKTTSLIGLGNALVERFDGEVPKRLADLTTLPGVGRKTANVVLGNAFGVPGITVDTHVGRLVRRWRLTAEEDPVKAEHAIAALIPRKDWTMFSHRTIFHGRRVCHARRPACGACTLAKLCPSYGVGVTDPHAAAKLLKGPRAAELADLAGVPK